MRIQTLLILLTCACVSVGIPRTARTAAPPTAPLPLGDQLKLIKALLGEYKLSPPGKDRYVSEINLDNGDFLLGWKQSFEPLASFNRLERLSASGLYLADADIQPITRVRRLRALDLHNNGFLTDDICKLLATMPLLEEVDLTGTGVTDLGVVRLGELRQLRVLKCVNLRDPGLAALTKCRKLETLEYEYGKFTEEGARSFASMKGLKHMSMGLTILALDAQAHLRHLISLKSLEANQTGLTDVGFEAVVRLPALESFSFKISSVGPSKDALPNISLAKKLKTVRVRASGDDWMLKCLSKCKALEVIDANQSDEITDAGVAHLTRCEGLRELHIWQAKVTDACIAQLIKMKALRFVNLTDTGLTRKGIEHLRKARPDMKVDTRFDCCPEPH